MAIRFNPFTRLKLHGGSYIAPAGAEIYYKGQELADVTSQEDFAELEKNVIFEEEGLTALGLQRQVRATEAQPGPSSKDLYPGDGTLTQPLLAPSESNILAIESQALEKKKIDAHELLKLPKSERRAAMQRILEDPQVDAQEFLDRIHARMAEVDLQPIGVEVRFQDLNVSLQYIHASSMKRGAPLLHRINKMENLEPSFRKSMPDTEERTFTVLRNVSGVLRPGRMHLLTGPPGSGKTVLMRALAGKRPGKKWTVQGTLLYNNQVPDQTFDLQSSAMYVDRHDGHIAELTVRETLDLAAEAQGMEESDGSLYQLKKAEEACGLEHDPDIDAYVDALMHDAEMKHTTSHVETLLYLFGLYKCADTVVGNEVLRGVTGLQRKLLTLAEACAGRRRLLYLDNPTAGLDAESELQYFKMLKRAVDNLQLTVLVCHDQPSRSTLALFDELTVLSEGYVVYTGPQDEAVPFFESQGFKMPAERDAIDFINMVTTPGFQQMFTVDSNESKCVRPREFHEAFAKSNYGSTLQMALQAVWAVPPKKEKDAPQLLSPLIEHRYGGRRGMLKALWALTKREYILNKRSPMLVMGRWIVTFATALITSLIWWFVPPNSLENGVVVGNLLFFSVIREYTCHFPETNIFTRQLGSIIKQRDNAVYPAWLAMMPMGIGYAGIVSFIDATIYTMPVYWITGLAAQFGRFLAFWLMLWWVGWLGIITFRIFAALGKKVVRAQYITYVWLLLSISMAGNLIHRSQIRGWMIWIFWLQPLSWMYRAFMINEFVANRWHMLYPFPIPGSEGSDESPAFSESLGRVTLDWFSMQSAEWWIWVGGWLFVWGFILLFLLALAVAISFVQESRPRPSIPEDIESQQDFERYAAIKEDAALNREAKQETEAGNVTALGEGDPALPPSTPEPSPSKSDSTATTPIMSTTGTMPEVDATRTPSPQQDAAPAAITADDSAYNTMATLKSYMNKMTNEIGSLGSKMTVSLPAWTKRKAQADKFLDLGSLAENPVIPFTPVTLTCKHLGYHVHKSGTHPREYERRYLLRDISAMLRPGVITAIMGNTGSGKKLLLDVVAQRRGVPGGVLEGDVRVNGYPLDKDALKRVTGYVQQIDALDPYLTVKEVIQFSARTHLPREITLKLVDSHVEQVMRLCDLSLLANVRIGIPFEKGLSQEQRRRVSIARVLAGNPSLLAVDEPTTRMDTRDATIIMHLLKKIAATGRTVVCTLHMPRAEVFTMCDDLLLLKPGGRPVYFGALGENAAFVKEYFESLEGIAPVSPDCNPAMWVMEAASSERELQMDADLYEVYKSSELYRNMCEIIDEYHSPNPNSYKLPTRSNNKVLPSYPISPFAQFALLVRANWWHSTRDGRYNGVRYAYTLTTSILLGLLWWNQGNKRLDPQGLQQIFGAIFTAIVSVGLYNAVAVIQPTAWQRVIATQELSTSKGMFAAAQAMNEGFWTLLQSILFVLPWYFMLSFFTDAGKLFFFFFLYWLTLWYFTLLGMSFTNLFRTVPFASAAAAFVVTCWIMTCGYLMPWPQMRGWTVWFYFINPLAWSCYGLTGTQLANIDLAFTFFPSGITLSIRDAVLTIYGFHYWQSAAISTIYLLWSVFFFALINYLALRLLDHQRHYTYKYIV